MTDPKDLPPEVRRHMDRQRHHQSQPIPTDRPTLEQMTSGPAFKRARLIKRAEANGDLEEANRLRDLPQSEIDKIKES